MRYSWTIAFLALAAAGLGDSAACAAEQPALPENYSCMACHSKDGFLYNEDNPVVTVGDLAGDVHWAKGLRCHDCHGGNPVLDDYVDHREDPTFRFIESPADVPGFCGRCHEDGDYMGRYKASANTQIVEEFWKSGHGLALEAGVSPEEANVPTCVACHGEQAHGIRAVDDPESPAHPTRLMATCGDCHKTPWHGLGEGVHAHAGEKNEDGSGKLLGCGKCHGEDAHGIRAVDDPESPAHPTRLTATCGDCHKIPWHELGKGVHAHAGEKNEDGSGKLLGCDKCHGEDAHGMLPVRDSRSPVFLDNQVLTCGGCHPEDLESYRQTVHGKGLSESGLLVTAVCADCHGAHGIYYAADKRSTLHSANVADTCAECHLFIQQQLEDSVHGSGNGPGGTTEKPPPGGKWRRKPSCTDCHQGHHLLRPSLAPFRQQLANRCGNCHPDLSSRYAMSLHGQLTQLGYEPAAKCSDCHGAHDILPVSDPQSHLALGENRLQTCRQCHVYAVRNFTEFDPHANHEDAENYPTLHFTYRVILTLFLFFFAFFVVHAFLWFLRSFVHTFQHGGHKTLVTGQSALILFEPIHRALYAVLMVSFLGLMLTGLPLKYSSHGWAQSLARGLGGFGSTSIWHHFFAVAAIFCCTAHLAWGASKIVKLRGQKIAWRAILFGPDSPVPNRRDLKDMLGMSRWFLGLGPRPVFERWTYWEKFDYWAAYLAVGVIGISGLFLWYPNLFCTVLPGEALNVALTVHSELAILAASFLFIFHFFHTHFRPEKFPMDLSALTGMVSEAHLRKHRPEYVERLRREGKLDRIRHTAPSSQRLRLAFMTGFLVFSMGLCLLAVILLASLGK